MNILLFLGAGFSAEAGLPLQNDFAAKAYSLLEKGQISLDTYHGVSSAYNLVRDIEGDKRQVTLEDAFGVLEFFHLTHDDDFKIAYYDNLKDPATHFPSDVGIPILQARRDFISAIEAVFGCNEDKPYENLDLYKAFFDSILQENSVVIVTTNYDLICETVLKQRYTHFPVWPAFEPETPIPVLKLHGSVDWKETEIDLANIIPPTWMKSFDKKGKYGIVWRWAEYALRWSKIVLFIGYSMPEIDREIEYLVKSGLQWPEMPGLTQAMPKTIIVVNPSDAVVERYGSLETLGSVKALRFRHETFRDFVGSCLDRSIDEIARPSHDK